MGAVDGSTTPPPELSTAWLCGKYHLPESGAMFDQDYTLITRMRVLSNIYNAVSKMRNLSGDDINTKLSTAERILLGDLQKAGINLGGLRA